MQEMDGATVMDQKIGCSWALKPKPAGAARGGGGMGRGGRGGYVSDILYFGVCRFFVFFCSYRRFAENSFFPFSPTLLRILSSLHARHVRVSCSSFR